MEHTKEPWQYERIPAVFNPKMDVFQIIAATPNGNDVMTVALCTIGEADEQNARRIVACVNSCAGISTEDLEAFKRSADLSWMMSIAQVVKQRDELMAALESVWLWMEDQADGQSKGGHATFDLMMLREQRDIARAAIDKAKGAKA